MFKEFFLRRRAFQVGQTMCHVHESADVPVHTGSGLMDLGLEQHQAQAMTKQAASYVFTFQWVKGLLSWALTSAGTISEAAFVLAPLWILINASVHPFVRVFLPEAITKDISYFADTLLVGIPELIALSAIITVLAHLSMWIYQGKKPESRITAMWFFTFGLPTGVFIVITLLTLWYSLANVAFQLPTWAVQVRGIAAYWYGIASLLYVRLGRPQEAHRLREKDATIAALQEKMRTKLAEIEAHKDAMIAGIQRENERLNQQLETAIGEKSALYKALNQSSDSALQAYGDEVIQWLNSLDKSVSLDAIAANTGMNKRRLQTAIDRKELRVRGTNKELIWTPSLRKYLMKNAPKQEHKARSTDGMLALHIVNQ